MASAREIAIAAASAKIVGLLEELPGYWITAEETAQCCGLPLNQASKITQKLASSGRVETRSVEWRSGRSRTRRRSEYRTPLAPDTPVRARLPAWLEPPIYPVDQRFVRFVPGRETNEIFKDKLAMNEQDLAELPTAVREAYSAIQDSKFSEHPEVIDAKQRLTEAESRHKLRAGQAVAFREQWAALEERRRCALIEIERIDAGRPELLASILFGDGNMISDRKLQAKRAELEHLARSVATIEKIAKGRLETILSDVRYAAQAVDSAEENYRGTLDELKLDQAKRQAFT